MQGSPSKSCWSPSWEALFATVLAALGSTGGSTRSFTIFAITRGWSWRKKHPFVDGAVLNRKGQQGTHQATCGTYEAH